MSDELLNPEFLPHTETLVRSWKLLRQIQQATLDHSDEQQLRSLSQADELARLTAEYVVKRNLGQHLADKLEELGGVFGSVPIPDSPASLLNEVKNYSIEARLLSQQKQGWDTYVQTLFTNQGIRLTDKALFRSSTGVMSPLPDLVYPHTYRAYALKKRSDFAEILPVAANRQTALMPLSIDKQCLIISTKTDFDGGIGQRMFDTARQLYPDKHITAPNHQYHYPQM